MMGMWDDWGAADWKDLTIFTEEEMQLSGRPWFLPRPRNIPMQNWSICRWNTAKTGRLAPIAPRGRAGVYPTGDPAGSELGRKRDVYTGSGSGLRGGCRGSGAAQDDRDAHPDQVGLPAGGV